MPSLYAERALDANREMISRLVMFDRSLRTVNLGSCAPFPISEIMPLLQERLPGKTLSAELQDSDEKLIRGLKNQMYQIIIIHEDPDDKTLYCQRYVIWKKSCISQYRRTIPWQRKRAFLLMI